MTNGWFSLISDICNDVNQRVNESMIMESMSEPSDSGSVLRQLKCIDPEFLSELNILKVVSNESPISLCLYTTTPKFKGIVRIIKSDEDSTKFNINVRGNNCSDDIVGVFLEDLIRTIKTKIL